MVSCLYFFTPTEGVPLREFPTTEQVLSLYGRNSISGTNLVAARSPRKRSILNVCEHCEGEADAERAHTATKKRLPALRQATPIFY